jgi:Trk-type K+ transport system membrane component
LIDSLFTATSAVCVTGLSTVDVPTKFTALGMDILLILILL